MLLSVKRSGVGFGGGPGGGANEYAKIPLSFNIWRIAVRTRYSGKGGKRGGNLHYLECKIEEFKMSDSNSFFHGLNFKL